MHQHSRKSYLLNPQPRRIFFKDSATAAVGMALLLLSCQLTAGCHSQPVVLPRIGSNSVDAGAVAEMTGLDRKVVDKAMTELKNAGRIESPRRCYWQPAS